MARKPNLFIVGAMKSGTTSLYQHLSAHPDIFMSSRKEPAYFIHKDAAQTGLQQYLDCFRDAGTQRYIGEGSTAYTKRPNRQGVAQRIHDFNPEARIVYIMRHPFKRMVSQYKHVAARRDTDKSFATALAESTEILSNSYYAYQIRPFFEAFGPEAIFCETFEALVASPAKFCKKIFRWLDVDADFVPPQMRTSFNALPPQVTRIDNSSAMGMLALKARSWDWTRKLAPRTLRRRIAAMLPQRVEVDVDSLEFLEEAATCRDALRPVLMQWTCELEQLTGRTYPEWAFTEETHLDPSKVLPVRRQLEAALAHQLRRDPHPPP